MPHVSLDEFFMPRNLTAVLALVLLALLPLAPTATAMAPEDRSLLADELSRQAFRVLGLGAEPLIEDVQRCAVLLDEALKLKDDDPELWRWRAEAALRLEDQEAYRTSLAKVVALDPGDEQSTVALILAVIGSRNAIDAQVEGIRNLVESRRGRAMSPAIRSRLASYAAQLCDELGREDERNTWIATALRWDPTNPQAVGAQIAMLAGQPTDPVAFGQTLIRAIRSNPINPQTRLSLAELLLPQAVYARASEQFAVAAQLQDGALSPAHYQAWGLCLSALRQDEDVLELTRLVSYRFAGIPAPARGAPQDPNAPVPPMPPALALLQLMTFDAPGEQAAAQRIIDGLLLPILANADPLTPSEQGAAASQPRATQPSTTQPSTTQAHNNATSAVGPVSVRVEIARLISLRGTDPAQALVALDNLPDQHPHARSLRAAVLFRDGQADAALEALGENTALDDGFAALIRLFIQAPDRFETRRRLQAILRDHPNGLGAILASRELIQLDLTPEPTPAGQELIDAMQSTPPAVWRLDTQTSPWTNIKVTLPPEQVRFLDPINVEVRLWNTAPIPLNLGEAATLSGTVLLDLQPKFGGQFFTDWDAFINEEPQAQLPPAVLRFNGPLTLRPGERYTETLRLDRQAFGRLMLRYPELALSASVTAISEPMIQPNGAALPGLLGQYEIERPGVFTLSAPLTTENLRAWMSRARGMAGADQWKALARLTKAHNDPDRPSMLEEFELDAIRDLIAEAYRLGDEHSRAWILSHLPADPAAQDRYAPLLDQAAEDPNVLPRLMLLAQHATDPEDPRLVAMLRERDPMVRNFARATQDSLVAHAEAKAAAEAAAREAEEDDLAVPELPAVPPLQP